MLTVLKALSFLTLWSPNPPHMASDCVLALIYGRLPALKRNDFDVSPLSEEDFDVVDIQSRQFIADISLALIMGELAPKISRNITPAQEQMPIAELLSGWMMELHPDLSLYDDNGDRRAHYFPVAELHIQYFGAVILSQAMPSKCSKQWACSTACLIAASCIAELYEEILYREEPENEEMEAQRKESLGVLCSVIEQLNHRFGIAKTVARKIKILQRERETILEQRITAPGGRDFGEGSVDHQTTSSYQLTALFPQLQAWTARRESGHQNAILDTIAQTRVDNEAHGVEPTVQWISEAPLSAFDALGAPGFMDDFLGTGYLHDGMDFELRDMVSVGSIYM
ncbi:hypothetical protein MY8738_008269 [Beauveria namnaoensis]